MASFGEELRRIESEVVPVRTEVVVDDVDEHHELPLMGGVDECLELLGGPVGGIGGEGQDAVVTPAPLARKLGEQSRYKLMRCFFPLSYREFKALERRVVGPAEPRVAPDRGGSS